MIILAILATLAGITALCWLLFNLAVFVLPLFAGVTVGAWAHETGAGIPGAVIVGAVAAALTFSLFQFLLLVARPAWIKLVAILAFVAPAAVAGYHATFGIVKLTMPSDTWQLVFSVVGAAAVGVTAFMRLTLMTPPGPVGQNVARA
jgi:glucan phosphoethanolaminetransferase (alkaline phosphatase superfamily)